jgi:hypothetical protein
MVLELRQPVMLGARETLGEHVSRQLASPAAGVAQDLVYRFVGEARGVEPGGPDPCDALLLAHSEELGAGAHGDARRAIRY